MVQFNPEMMKVMVEARHEDIRNTEAAIRAAKQVQGEQPNRAKELLNTVVSFAKGLGSQSTKAVRAANSDSLRDRQRLLARLNILRLVCKTENARDLDPPTWRGKHNMCSGEWNENP